MPSAERDDQRRRGVVSALADGDQADQQPGQRGDQRRRRLRRARAAAPSASSDEAQHAPATTAKVPWAKFTTPGDPVDGDQAAADERDTPDADAQPGRAGTPRNALMRLASTVRPGRRRPPAGSSASSRAGPSATTGRPPARTPASTAQGQPGVLLDEQHGQPALGVELAQVAGQVGDHASGRARATARRRRARRAAPSAPARPRPSAAPARQHARPAGGALGPGRAAARRSRTVSRPRRPLRQPPSAQVVVDGQVGESCRPSGTGPAARRPRTVPAAGAHDARDRVLTSVDLPAPFGPMQRDHLAAPTREADAVERGRRAVADDQVVDRQHAHDPRLLAEVGGDDARVRPDLGRCALGDDPAEVEHGDPVGQPGHERRRRARRAAWSARRRAAPRSGRRGARARRARRPDAGSSSSSSRGSPAQRAGQLQRPLLAERAAASAGRSAHSASPTRSRQSRRAARISPLLAAVPGQPQRRRRRSPARVVRVRADHHVLQRGHAAEDPGALEDDRDAEPGPPVRRQPVDAAPPKVTRPAVRRQLAADEVEQRGLAGAVGPDDAAQLAVRDVRSTSRTA